MASGERTIFTVVRDVVDNLQDIIRSEVRLAKAELREELTRARSAALLFGVGIVAATFSILFVLLASVYALSRVLPAWAAALVVAAAVAVVAVITLPAGMKRFKSVEAAPKTAASVKETITWAKQQTK
jgi:uncharacterized membrane protein YqjE